MSSEANVAKAGLEGIVAAQSAISDVNGIEGRLIYAGYDIHDLAEHSTFEETIYLLWQLRLPTASELEDLKVKLAAEAALPDEIHRLIVNLPSTASPMDVLRTVVSALGHSDSDSADNSEAANVRKAVRLTARLPIIVTSFQRARNGQAPIRPRRDFSLAANFLYTA